MRFLVHMLRSTTARPSSLLSVYAFAILAGFWACSASAAETIHIKAIAGLQYDVKQFAVRPSQAVQIVFENADTTDMPHNLIFTVPGGREAVVNAAIELGGDAEKMGYVPKVPQVLWAIPAIGPEGKKTLAFTTPAESGIYPYVCTLPGHGVIMFGDMYVGVAMPAAGSTNSESTPPTGGADSEAHAGHHHGAGEPAMGPQGIVSQRPAVIRTFMPDAGPASIAVALPGTMNYCWDAVQCRFRYAWSGPFIDNYAYWKGNGDGLAKLLGKVGYRTTQGQPLRFKPTQEPVVAFKGYHLSQGVPTFNYTIDGIAVEETVTTNDAGALIWHYAIATDQSLTYQVDPAVGSQFSSSLGNFTAGILTIPKTKARSFTITLAGLTTTTKGDAP